MRDLVCPLNLYINGLVEKWFAHEIQDSGFIIANFLSHISDPIRGHVGDEVLYCNHYPSLTIMFLTILPVHNYDTKWLNFNLCL